MSSFPHPPKVAIPADGSSFQGYFRQSVVRGVPAGIKVQLWGGSLWSEGYAVRTAGDVTCLRLKNTLTAPNWRCSPRKGRVVHFGNFLYEIVFDYV